MSSMCGASVSSILFDALIVEMQLLSILLRRDFFNKLESNEHLQKLLCHRAIQNSN